MGAELLKRCATPLYFGTKFLEISRYDPIFLHYSGIPTMQSDKFNSVQVAQK